MRDLSVPPITRPERFFPQPELVQPLERRWLPDGYGEVWNPEAGEWEYSHPICLHVLDALEKGLNLDEMAQEFPAFDNPPIARGAVKALARKYIWRLVRRGDVRMDLEELPEVFHGRYRRVRELGRGGLGIASLCEDQDADGRLVVVKRPWGVLNPIESGQRSLAVEIDALSRCDHPAIPTLYDSFQADGLLHMVREFVDGDSVVNLYKGTGLSDPADRLDVARQAAAGVHHLHTRDLLLLDAGPSNYMRRSDGRVLITDLGACEPLVDGEAAVRGMRSAPGYTPAEMRAPGPDGLRHLTRAADVDVFGRFLYFLVTGARPSRSWYAAELSADLEARGVAGPERRIIEACTRDDPARRPQDMLKVLEMLQTIETSSDSPPGSAPPGRAEQGRGPSP